MNERIKEKWLKALRSGKYKQGKGELREGGKFCCLGVLCDLYTKEKNVPWNSLVNLSKLLPLKVQRWAGLKEMDPSVPLGSHGWKITLSVLNDGAADDGVKDDEVRKDFKGIANLIEEYL